MLKSYFFVPANRPRFINKISDIKADTFVLDLEDAVVHEDTLEALNNISYEKSLREHYVRPGLYNAEDRLQLDLLEELIAAGFKHFVLPKIKDLKDIVAVFNILEGNNHILLVERPSLLNQLNEVLYRFKDSITAIGFGSQDFASFMNMKQDKFYLNNALFTLKLIAQAHNKQLIDTASMLIDDEINFEHECINAFNMGADGKFVIHPKQLKVLKNAMYFSKEELQWGRKALFEIGDKLNRRNIGALKVDGQVLEKPHLNKLMQIKQYLDNEQT